MSRKERFMVRWAAAYLISTVIVGCLYLITHEPLFVPLMAFGVPASFFFYFAYRAFTWKSPN